MCFQVSTCISLEVCFQEMLNYTNLLRFRNLFQQMLSKFNLHGFEVSFKVMLN